MNNEIYFGFRFSSLKNLNWGGEVCVSKENKMMYVLSIASMTSRMDMAKRTKKFGIIGKYETHYGASLRKKVKNIEISQHINSSFVSFCGSCMKTVASGTWTYNTTSAITVKSTIRRLKGLKDQ
ncbi:unnamed protein product [Nyctereutes procyonoides]|uniref:(raccoon dog) hypothetical protein n=1 Tax=Nyctereutes procyonoides TaxID=34880 RepID=A0A811YZ59_NYCPR|nr:unnamed protein product [Nyctereutes procyonoides]